MAQMKFQYHVGTVDLSTSAPSAAERCTQYGYGLIATGRQIALHFWRATPAFYRDCSNRCRNRSASAGTDGLIWVPIRNLIGVVPTNEPHRTRCPYRIRIRHVSAEAIASSSRILSGPTRARCAQVMASRSEERRVGKEWVRTGKSRWLPYHKKKKK